MKGALGAGDLRLEPRTIKLLCERTQKFRGAGPVTDALPEAEESGEAAWATATDSRHRVARRDNHRADSPHPS